MARPRLPTGLRRLRALLGDGLGAMRSPTREDAAPAASREYVAAVRRSGDEPAYEEPPAPAPSNLASFDVLDGWTTRFVVDGQEVGGSVDLTNDGRVVWGVEAVGGVEEKRVLELGPLEGAHTMMLLERGAAEVVAVEGFRPCFLRCLIVKEIFGLTGARFLYGDFRRYVQDYRGEPFDVVLASGVLYHQTNPAELIHDLARVTSTVIVWSQVADDEHPPGRAEVEVAAGGQRYRGRVNDYGGGRNLFKNYCGGVDPTAVWLYPDELRRGFVEAGFTERVESPIEPSVYGPSLLLVASKNQLPGSPAEGSTGR